MEIPPCPSDEGNVPHTFSIPSCREPALIRLELSSRRRVTRRASQRIDSISIHRVLEAEPRDRHSMSRIVLGLGIAVFCRSVGIHDDDGTGIMRRLDCFMASRLLSG
jgi:hypothetical protein